MYQGRGKGRTGNNLVKCKNKYKSSIITNKKQIPALLKRILSIERRCNKKWRERESEGEIDRERYRERERERMRE